jgi:hypothetical protein
VQQAFRIHIIVIINVAEPPADRGEPCALGQAQVGAPTLLSPGLCEGGQGKTTAHLRPDSMNLSYSTDILQQRAWRVRTAEQLVLMTRPSAKLEKWEA